MKKERLKENKKKTQDKNKAIARPKKDYAKIIYGNLPNKYRQKLEMEAIYAGIELPIYRYITSTIKTTYIILFTIFAIAYLSINMNIIVASIIIGIILIAGIIMPYIIFTVTAEKRTKNIEKVLPDLLILAASNIKSGLTIDKALLFAARDEFGTLSNEIKKTAFKIYGGIEITEAFNSMTERINSGHLKRTVTLLMEGIRSGGNTATLLEESAKDIETSKTLQKEINTSVQMYIIFIILAGVIAAPVMFAISNYLIESTSNMWGDVDTNSDADIGAGILKITPSSSEVDSVFFTFFAAAALAITTIFGGMLISLIKFGNIKHSVKYSPGFTVVALSLFFISRALVAAAMGGLA
ncbi:MAG: type II secretion system F family protein [DPANN group archaeon]|nr:type II secretion system F family protein [DPANN group archaeon]